MENEIIQPWGDPNKQSDVDQAHALTEITISPGSLKELEDSLNDRTGLRKHDLLTLTTDRTKFLGVTITFTEYNGSDMAYILDSTDQYLEGHNLREELLASKIIGLVRAIPVNFPDHGNKFDHHFYGLPVRERPTQKQLELEEREYRARQKD